MLDANTLPIVAEPVNTQVSLSEAINAGTIAEQENYRQSLLDIINQVSAKKYSVATCEFIEPKKTIDGSVRNTSVLLVELPNLGLFNPKVVNYNRVHTSKIGTVKIQKFQAVRVSDLLTRVNTLKDTTILVSEIIDSILPDSDTEGFVTFDLQFQDSSFRYYSGPEIVLSTIGSTATLSDASTVTSAGKKTKNITFVNGLISQIDYSNTDSKKFSWNGYKLLSMQSTKNTKVTKKNVNWDGEIMQSITEVIV